MSLIDPKARPKRRIYLGVSLVTLVLMAALFSMWRAFAPAPAMPPPAVVGAPVSPPAATTKNVDPIGTVTPANSTPDTPVVAAPRTAAAFRATADQRARDLLRFGTEGDLSALAAEWQARAEIGDADAAQALAGLYENCAGAASLRLPGASLAENRESLEVIGFGAAELAIMERSFESLATRCSEFASRTPDQWLALVRSWRARAVALGHPGARLSAPRIHRAGSPAAAAEDLQMRNAGIELLQDGNPMDLAAYAVPLANHSPYRHEGYLLAACNLTPACAPDPAAYALATLQIQHFTGFGMSFFRLRELSPRQRQIAQGQSEEIIRLWGLRRFDEMLVGRPRRHGNGG